MKPVTPILNFLEKSNKTGANPLTKTTKYFFVLLHIIFALDFGFIKLKSSRNRILLKLESVASSSAIFIYHTCILFDPNYGNTFYMWYFVHLVLYYVFSLTLLVSKYTYYDYLTDLHSFDFEIDVDSSTYQVEYKMIMWFCFTIIYRILLSFMSCWFDADYCVFPFISHFIYVIAIGGSDIVSLVYTFVFYSAYIRLKRFKSYVRRDDIDVIACQYLYKNLVEIVEKMKKSFDFVLILTLVTNTIDVTVSIYKPIAEEILAGSSHSSNMSVAYINVFKELLMLFSPAFTAGLLTGQVEELRLVLFDKLLKDKSQSKDINRFVAYVIGRPLSFKIWQVVPLDWRLPVIVINISGTYLIVMFQFTHKY